MRNPRLFLSFLALVLCLAIGSPRAQGTATGTSGTAVRPSATVNLNTATVAELQTLPGIGVAVASRIVEYRQKQGPFKKIEELMNVKGIGEKSFLKLRPQITVGSRPDSAGQR